MLPLATAYAQPAMSWEDTVKEAIDATQHRDMPTAPDGTTTPSDLTLDNSFNGSGMLMFWPPTPPTNGTHIEDGLRVFQWRVCSPICFHRGYYVVGRVKNTNGTWQSSITRRKADGTLDLAFGTQGWMYPSSTNKEVVDAALGAGKMYILSTFDLGATPVMRVTCTDLATGDSCFAGFGGLIGFGASPSGAIRSAYARRIVYDVRYGLHIAGRIFTMARGWEVAIARLDKDTGALVTEFRNDGINTGLADWAAQTDSDIDVFDLAVVPMNYPGGERLYVAGTLKRTATDYDGFVVGINPINGFTSNGWGWNSFYFEDDNSGYKKDAITAITVQRNGKLAMAGWSETNVVNERSMILGRFKANGDYDYSFCDSSVICKRNDPWSGVVDDDLPAAIGERFGNRDLVVALKHPRPAASDPRPRQQVVQFGSSGNRKHAHRTLDFPAATGVTAWSRPFDMVIINTGRVTDEKTEHVVVAGTRKYDDSDYDGTLTQLFANDSIFADQFGGRNND